MINSMQYILVSSTSTSNNHNKKIASDLSFIYIEWQYKEVCEQLKLLKTSEEKKNYIANLRQDECPEIFFNFFIKLSIQNCLEKEEKDAIKRSLYLLKKVL